MKNWNHGIHGTTRKKKIKNSVSFYAFRGLKKENNEIIF